MARKLASVVLVGRPNVGKSTLFNRMTGSRRAIVAPVAGTTRDALTRPVDWRGTRFDLFDTGGLFGASEDPLHELVVQQGQRAIGGADLLVMLVDGREGLVSGDERIASIMRTPEYTVYSARRPITFRSTNHLLGQPDVDVRAGKTGFISQAGYCLATLLRLPQGGQQVAVVVLGARSNAGRFMETRNLFSWLSNKASTIFSTTAAAQQQQQQQ